MCGSWDYRSEFWLSMPPDLGGKWTSYHYLAYLVNEEMEAGTRSCPEQTGGLLAVSQDSEHAQSLTLVCAHFRCSNPQMIFRFHAKCPQAADCFQIALSLIRKLQYL